MDRGRVSRGGIAQQTQMELYPRYFTALGNGRQADMERLNDIFKRNTQQPQRRRPEGQVRPTTAPASQYMRPGSGPGSTPARRPLPEQTARIGEYSRAYQAERQHPQSPSRYPRGEQNAFSP